MALPLERLPVELLRELRRYRWAAVGLFALVSFAVLAVGFIYPYQYRSEVVIFVDDNNIIGPLMEGSAEITTISNQTSSARELLYSRRVLEKLIESERIYPDADNYSTERMEALYGKLRSNISVNSQGDNYFAIRYQGQNPRESFLIAQRLGQLFIEESNRRKRSESRNAYEFIDKQVKSYEQQIRQTEQQRMVFLSEHTEGTESEANQRMAQLRRDIDSAELELEEVQAQERSLEEQIETLPATVASGGGSSDGGLTGRINRMEERLDELKLRYEDSYPDVASLERQIEELKQRRQQMQAGDMEPSDDSGLMFNPVYQEIKTDLSRARTRQESLRTRINALQRRLAQQEDRMEVIQGNRAERSELTRDLQVNREIYNDLLKRRERARVSMSLDVEGQGLSYEINEQARYPVSPAGLQFRTFASVGWLLGLMAPIGLLAALLQIDPRVRSTKQIQDALQIPLLGSIPLVRTPFERRRERRGYVFMVVIVLLIVAGYVSVVSLQATGVLG
ncbi:polysaccharide chain length determinant protein (PEP-CTERM system associated) [Halospina denitrificans]|uniref:Polysaccharide chain length determinant protein (PEP-CTERM system associated) n=1 Tax=Halospina denitrificans TaxID=332522 RepID=A0A4R7JNP7_9GAMM|nr:XrtA system polysaccharide chain length determinant [Halospina denitrificans]TDT39465.1 polysaccharide chain length determinant protein (PEP-CTERM system associated) [Halospina denitrificans]